MYICDYSIIETQDLSNVTRPVTTVSGHPSTNEEEKEKMSHSLYKYHVKKSNDSSFS